MYIYLNIFKGMYKELINKPLTILCVPVGLFVLLIPFSLLIGWNIFTLLIFWFILTPVVAEYLPTIFSKNKSLMTESLIGMLIFYSLLVFMIYEHYQTDLFSIMVASCLINLASITIISKVKKEYRNPAY